MQCKKCHAVLPEGSIFCCFCGKKQTTGKKPRAHKRATGTGTISKNPKCKKNPYIVRAPATSHGTGRVYIGSYPDMVSAQTALEAYMRNGRPALYNATLADVYKLWSEVHFTRVSQAAVNLYTAMWKRFHEIERMKMTEIKTAHFQQLITVCTSKSSAETVKAMAVMMCRWAMENDIVQKNYAEFVKLPKFEKKEKMIFTDDQIAELWRHSEDKRVQAVLVMIYMGFRIGELLMITPDRVNFAEGYITAGEKTEAGRERAVPFPPEIPEIAGFVRSWCSGVPDDTPLWDMTDGNFRSKVFYDTLDELGMVNIISRKGNVYKFSDQDHLTPHSTRHTFASLSSRSGMRPEELKKIIGHASYSVTADVYIHKDIAELRTAMTTLKKAE